jgi:hypothetical protein
MRAKSLASGRLRPCQRGLRGMFENMGLARIVRRKKGHLNRVILCLAILIDEAHGGKR